MIYMMCIRVSVYNCRWSRKYRTILKNKQIIKTICYRTISVLISTITVKFKLYMFFSSILNQGEEVEGLCWV